jgi:hypothetical protein
MKGTIRAGNALPLHGRCRHQMYAEDPQRGVGRVVTLPPTEIISKSEKCEGFQAAYMSARPSVISIGARPHQLTTQVLFSHLACCSPLRPLFATSE